MEGGRENECKARIDAGMNGGTEGKGRLVECLERKGKKENKGRQEGRRGIGRGMWKGCKVRMNVGMSKGRKEKEGRWNIEKK